MKKIKLLSSLATASVIGAVAPIINTSCSTDPSITTNYMIYEGRRYELANNFNPNNLCGEEFVIPLKDGSILPIVSIFKALITKIVINIPTRSVTSIKDHFLEGCMTLTGEDDLDLSGLSNVTSIGNYFMSGCTALKTFDFRPMKSLKRVGQGFAYRCDNLVHVNTGYLDINNFDDSDYTFASDNAKTRAYGVGIEIEGEYKSNMTLKFRPEDGENDLYRYLVSDSSNFVTGYIPVSKEEGAEKVLRRMKLQSPVTYQEFCNPAGKGGTLALTEQGQTEPWTVQCDDVLNVSLRNVVNTGEGVIPQTIPDHFLDGCSSMINMLWGEDDTITGIGHYFLRDCLAFSTVDMSPFPNVENIGDSFLENTHIMYLDLDCFNNEAEITIGKNFVTMCDYLIYVDMGDIQAKNVGGDLTDDYSFSAKNNLTALSVILGITIDGSNCSQYLSRFPNGLSGELISEFYLRNIKIIDII